jgi:hypothetical protein
MLIWLHLWIRFFLGGLDGTGPQNTFHADDGGNSLPPPPR